MIFGKNRAFLYPTKVLADTNKKIIRSACLWTLLTGLLCSYEF